MWKHNYRIHTIKNTRYLGGAHEVFLYDGCLILFYLYVGLVCNQNLFK